ncbi:hypothetical protein [Labilibacter marinus]|uniref:hypothetical protein n=1 Tax=Labilibacter marinus TaxID=1477105 RepID=UPI0009501DF8|nr:hypothetical protein [Labilibacter marinus]
MRLNILLLLLLVIVPTGMLAQEFTPQQQAYLYKIVRGTSCLRQNWNHHFLYTGGIPETKKVVEIVNGRTHTYYVDMWDSIIHSIVLHPELLRVDWNAIRKTSPGLMADASVKLSLWELYSNIKAGYVQNTSFYEGGDVKIIYQEMVESLPLRMKKGAMVKEKYLPVFYDIINPSLSINRKFESFDNVGKVTVQEKKKVFDRWHQLVTSHVAETSEQYFNSLLGNEVYFKGSLLAVGDGSGSSGLLGEREDGEEGPEINTGTGKGIGLFTYKMKVRKGELSPDYLSEVEVKTLQKEPILIHLTLWGMDWDKYPTVVVEKGQKSYVLIGTPQFSPDPNRVEGTSYFDRLVDYKKRKIDNVVTELNKEGGLLAVYERENSIKEIILNQIDSINLEIDSLRKLDYVSAAAIDNRKFKNEVNLTNLRDKERRLADVQRKISAEYKKISHAEQELNKMKIALGEQPQNWENRDSVYVFEDGSFFDVNTQDLFLFQDSNKHHDIRVKLLAATYSVYRDSKDEVQLYVNATGGVKDYLKELERNKEPSFVSDTLVNSVYYFEPDEYIASSFFTSEQRKKLGDWKSSTAQQKTFVFDLKAMGVDALNHDDFIGDQANYSVNKNKVNYINARRVQMQLVETNDSCIVKITGYADAGRTQLSTVTPVNKKNWQPFKSKEQSLNTALSALRIIEVVKELETILDESFDKESILVVPLNKAVKVGGF